MPSVTLADGVRLHYREAGQGEPLVLLHGLGSSGADWEYQIPAFAEHYRVIVPDLRGSGDSDKPRGPYRISRFADDIWQLLDALDIESARLVGLSMGGATAFEMAASQPQRTTALVVVNCPPDFAITSLRKLLEVAMRLAVVQCLGMPRMAAMIGDRLFPDADQAELRETFVQRYGANRKREYLWSLRSLPGWSVTDRLSRIDCPALMVAAANDYTPVAEKQVAVDALPRGELSVVDNSRHATPIDSPDRFNALVLDFLQRQDA
ncbi:alpha/beta hydrolase [Salinisphaera sp. P385]|uniref:Alpha/beta hydrolase n=1 Tax=Spectribacter acetivorans TaxID=3075603 RepID=A0ABU3B7I5_9GAMM|nr:alpha/beta hydrolase [Salinisphaera sp. P385]MDT0617792.1 alpha/beta hydrolase [Salinisphaera sp. P385]